MENPDAGASSADAGGGTADAASGSPDAAGGSPDAGTSASCSAPPAGYGDVGEIAESEAQVRPIGGEFSGRASMWAYLEDSDVTDVLEIELWEGVEPFANGIAPGTYEITGEELSPFSCGLCVRVWTDFDRNAGEHAATSDEYAATGGTLTLTEIGPEGSNTLVASLSNVTFTHVTYDSDADEYTAVGDCDTEITSANWDLTCTASHSYGALGDVSSEFSAKTIGTTLDSGNKYVRFEYEVAEPAGFYDVLYVELWEGYGVFADGIVPGTYQLPSQPDYSTCGLCPVLSTKRDFDHSFTEQTEVYMPTGGTVTITEVGEPGSGNFAASLSDVSFTDVEVDPETYETTVVDHCGSAIESGSWDVPIELAQ